MLFIICLKNVRRLRASDAAVVLYSITDRSSFHSAREALEAMAAAGEEGDEEGGDGGGGGPIEAPVLLLGNKVDLSHLRKVSGVH